jgi:O-antigen/teichoic acid export membrane protein
MRCWAFAAVDDRALPIEAPPTLAQAAVPPKSTYAGDVLKLVGGTITAQAIGVLLSPVLTRLYAPEAFGTMALFTSITGIIGVVACLRYELAIMLPKTDEEATSLLAVSLLSVVAVTLLSIPVVTLGRPLLLRMLRAPELGSYLWLVPVMVFLAGVFTALDYWNSRTRHFGRLSVVRVISSATTYAGNLGIAYAGHATTGTLIIGSVIGAVFSSVILGVGTWRDDGALVRENTRASSMWEGLVRYRRFPQLDVWSALMNMVSAQLPALLLSAFFSPAIAGFYALGHRVLSMPMGLAGGAIAQVFYQRASVAKTTGTLPQVVDKTLRRLMALAAFPFMLLMVISPDLFMFVFGKPWREAGIYAQILSPWLFFVFLGAPISTLYCALEKQTAGVLFNASLIVTRAASLMIGSLLGDSRVALVLFSASGTVMWAGFCLYLALIAGVRKKALLQTVVGRIVVASLFVFPVVLARWIWDPPSPVIVLAGLSVSLLYYLYLFVHDGDLRSVAMGFLPVRRPGNSRA